MTPEQHRVRLASGDLEYFTVGEGRPLLLLHPAGGIRWTTVHEMLARTHRLYLPVMPGFDGTSTHAGVDSMQALGALAGEFIDTVIDAPCDVIGTSFGGWVSLWLTALRPERVGQLVLVGPAGFRPAGVGGAPGDPAALFRALYAHPEKLPPSSKTVEMEVANGRMRAHYNATRATDDELLARLGEVTCPTLILHGTEDRVIPKESVQLLKTRISASFLIYLWDAAHAPEVDQPERMASVIDSFLARGEAFVANWGTIAVNPG